MQDMYSNTAEGDLTLFHEQQGVLTAHFSECFDWDELTPLNLMYALRSYIEVVHNYWGMMPVYMCTTCPPPLPNTRKLRCACTRTNPFQCTKVSTS